MMDDFVVKTVDTQIWLSEEEEQLLRDKARESFITFHDLIQAFVEDGIKKLQSK